MLGCWGVTVATQLGWSPDIGFPPVVLTVGTKLLGHLCLLLMTGVYARHVLLDIQGLVPVRQRKPRVKRAKKTESRTEVETDSEDEPTNKKRIVIDPPHTATNSAPAKNRLSDVEATVSSASIPKRPAPSLPPAPTLPPANSRTNANHDDDDDDESSGRKLSRAERKRLRRQRDEG